MRIPVLLNKEEERLWIPLSNDDNQHTNGEEKNT